ELREEVVLDHRVGVVPEPVRVHDLLEDLGVQLLGRLAGVQLELGIEAEPHRPVLSELDCRANNIKYQRDAPGQADGRRSGRASSKAARMFSASAFVVRGSTNTLHTNVSLPHFRTSASCRISAVGRPRRCGATM